MNNYSKIYLVLLITGISLQACAQLSFPKLGKGGKVVTEVLTGNSDKGGSFTEAEAGQAIKEALNKGISSGVEKVSVTDGYFNNSFIKIPFPKEAETVETTLRGIGLGSMIDNVILTINRAAERAASEATAIFINAIKQMTVSDAINIVNNQQKDAATRFLERTTTEQLVAAFTPPIKKALDETSATKYWEEVMTRYNKIPFVTKVNPDLTDYVTRKAITGLFYMISLEEEKIRKDPLARTSEILKKVFGNVKF